MPRGRFSPASVGAGIAIPSVMAFAYGFYIDGHLGGLCKLYHKCVTDI